MPARPAIAVRWMTALVEPPIAISTRIAFSTERAVTIAIRRDAGLDQLDRGRAGRFSGAQAVGVNGGDRGGARQDHAECLGDAGHC